LRRIEIEQNPERQVYADAGEAMNPNHSQLRLAHLIVAAFLFLFVCPHPACPQSPAASPPSPAGSPDAAAPAPSAMPPPAQAPSTANSTADTKTEVAIQDSGTTFRLRVNLVQVHVVVQDSKGRPVDNLRKEDFLLYDQGKLQSISTFAIETRETRRAKAEAAAKTQVDEVDQGKIPSAALPDRFVALVFDDTHLAIEDIVPVKVQVGKFLDSVAPTDRIAIYSTSGQVTHGFTSDKEELKKTVLGLLPRAKFPHFGTDCPDVSHYEADQVQNKNNPQVMNVIVAETLQCAFNGDQRQILSAQSMAQSAVQIALVHGDTESQFVYAYMQDVLRHLAGMPGERVMVMVSPGFLQSTQQLDLSNVVEMANRSGIVINTIDGRGLYTPDLMGDITRPSSDTILTTGQKASYRIQAQTEQDYVLRDFAYGTGGTFFHNSNDLTTGLQLVGAAPEISYILGFSPQVLKMDGQFHILKVSLADKRKYSVQARRGYFAQRKFKDPSEQAKEEIQEAVFSRDEILDLPLQLQTQYFKGEDSSVHLSVVSRLELKGVHFRKAEGRNFDNLTLATVIFDDNGNFVTGGEKLVTMKLLDTTYEKLSHTGLVVKSSFEVKPGRYMIRQVVRDSEGSQMAARNGAVEIPY
jgi:VWFA-related protein